MPSLNGCNKWCFVRHASATRRPCGADASTLVSYTKLSLTGLSQFCVVRLLTYFTKTLLSLLHVPSITDTMGFITDGPGNYSVSTACSWFLSPPRLGPTTPVLRIRLESFATECGWDHLYVYDGDSVRAEKLLAVYRCVSPYYPSTSLRFG